MLDRANLPDEVFEGRDVVRGYVFGEMENGTRFWVDLHIPDPRPVQTAT
jgi:hypothetical protein